jgi:diguanylate cyclase (GGDEF)-like protein/PAS domain S-box-containing protein
MSAADFALTTDQYRKLLDFSSDPVFCFGPDCRYLYVNRAYAEGIGRKLEEVIGRTVWDVFSKDEAERRSTLIRFVFDQGQARTHELQVQGPDSIRHYLTTMTPIFDERGSVMYILANSKDITELRHAEDMLRESETYTRSILDSVSDQIAVIDQDGMVVRVNEPWRRFSAEDSSERGQSAPHVGVGTNYFDVFQARTRCHTEESKEAHKGIQSVLDGRVPSFSMEYTCHSAVEQRWFTMRVSPLDGQKRGAVIVHTNITERVRMERDIRELAFHDSLTQLPNRRLLGDRLNQAMATNKRSGLYGALMFIDLDNFKPLNDAYGHEAGDLLLIAAADRLKDCVREMDTVARFGGDEFVVMLSELAAEKAESAVLSKGIAEKIRISLSEPYQLNIKRHGLAASTVTHRCTASIGVALFLSHEASPDEVFKCADSAMYHSKASGRNSVCFLEHTNMKL